MKPSVILIALCAILLHVSCSKDDSGPSYSFQNQIAQGKINGKSWTFVEGYAKEDPFEAENIYIDLGAEDVEDPCGFLAIGGLRVFFSIKKSVTLTPLNFSLDEAQTVTLFEPDGNLNLIATEGAVEILTITDSQVTGRIDARYDDESAVNGKFTVMICTQ